MKNNRDGPTINLRPDSERAENWQIVFGRLDGIPITSYVPSKADLPGRPSAEVYMLDLKCLTPMEHILLVSVIAKRFNLSPRDVADDIAAHGCPILAADTTVAAIPMRLFT